MTHTFFFYRRVFFYIIYLGFLAGFLVLMSKLGSRDNIDTWDVLIAVAGIIGYSAQLLKAFPLAITIKNENVVLNFISFTEVDCFSLVKNQEDFELHLFFQEDCLFQLKSSQFFDFKGLYKSCSLYLMQKSLNPRVVPSAVTSKFLGEYQFAPTYNWKFLFYGVFLSSLVFAISQTPLWWVIPSAWLFVFWVMSNQTLMLLITTYPRKITVSDNTIGVTSRNHTTLQLSHADLHFYKVEVLGKHIIHVRVYSRGCKLLFTLPSGMKSFDRLFEFIRGIAQPLPDSHPFELDESKDDSLRKQA